MRHLDTTSTREATIPSTRFMGKVTTDAFPLEAIGGRVETDPDVEGDRATTSTEVEGVSHFSIQCVPCRTLVTECPMSKCHVTQVSKNSEFLKT